MDISAFILDAVRDRPIQGSQLAQLIRAQYPDWSAEVCGARNLRDYVERLVDGAGVVGRSGMDVVYGITNPGGASTDPMPAETPATEVNLWRIWVSPNSPYALSIDKASGVVSQVNRSAAATQEGALRLEPAPFKIHEAVARDFAARIHDERDISLPSTGGPDGWWFDWQKALKGLGLDASWHEHRASSLETALETALAELGLSDEAKEMAFARIVEDRSIRRRSAASHASERTGSRTDLEAIALAAIPKMSSSDLRELKIPLGIVLDVLAQHADQ